MKPRLQRGLRVTFLGMAVNTVLAAVKMLAGVFGHSHALVADAVESLADVFSSLVVWRALVVAETPADDRHPYGHGKAEPIASAIVATLLLLAAIWITLAALREMHQPHLAPAPYTLLVLVVVVVVKESLFRFVFREGVSVDSSAVKTDAWHHRSDAITSIAAAVGITAALLGGPGYESADDVAAIVAAGIIAWNGWRLLHPALDELMDIAPAPEVLEHIRRTAAGVSGVERIEKCIARKMGYQYYVDMHMEVDPAMTVSEAHRIAHVVKDRVRAEIPAILDVLIHIEPVIQKPPPSPTEPGAAAVPPPPGGTPTPN